MCGLPSGPQVVAGGRIKRLSRCMPGVQTAFPSSSFAPTVPPSTGTRLSSRRNSSPTVTSEDLEAAIWRQKKTSDSSIDRRKRHSSYIELLEEVTNELNLNAVKIDPQRVDDNGISDTSLIIQNAFDFLYTEDESKVAIIKYNLKY